MSQPPPRLSTDGRRADTIFVEHCECDHSVSVTDSVTGDATSDADVGMRTPSKVVSRALAGGAWQQLGVLPAGDALAKREKKCCREQ